MVQDRDVTQGKAAKLVEIIQEDGSTYIGGLPPIADIVIPSTLTKSATIRWLNALGYEVKEIYQHLGVRYQMVRNIIHTIPKRAAREDLPPLRVRYKPEKDPQTDGLDAALDESLMAGRKARKKAQKAQLRQDNLDRQQPEDTREEEEEEDDNE